MSERLDAEVAPVLVTQTTDQGPGGDAGVSDEVDVTANAGDDGNQDDGVVENREGEEGDPIDQVDLSLPAVLPDVVVDDEFCDDIPSPVPTPTHRFNLRPRNKRSATDSGPGRKDKRERL